MDRYTNKSTLPDLKFELLQWDFPLTVAVTIGIQVTYSTYNRMILIE